MDTTPDSLERALDAGSMTRRYGLDTGPLDLEQNTSPAYFEEEREKIFRHVWWNVGRVEDIANPGDFLVQDVPTLKTSVIIVRGRDGKIRAFHNMCKHRGNKVIRTEVESGSCKGFSCGFHGWTYDLTGKLVIVPDEDQFFNVDKAKNGLTPFPVDVWENFIFISAAPKQSLRDYLGGMADLFDGWFDGAVRISRYRADVKVNWKVCHDAFIEAYHAPFLHGRAYPDVFTQETNPLSHLLHVKLFELHRGVSVEGNLDHRPSPMESVLLKTADKVFPTLPPIDMNSLPPGVNPARKESWAFDGYVIFPTFYLAPMRFMHYVTYHFWPVSADRTLWQTEHYQFAPKDAGNRLAQEFTKVYARDVQTEDLVTLENTQSMLRSGGAREFYLSDQEVPVRHNYEVVKRLLGRKSSWDPARAD